MRAIEDLGIGLTLVSRAKRGLQISKENSIKAVVSLNSDSANIQYGEIDLIFTSGIDSSDANNRFKSASNKVDTRLLLINSRILAIVDDWLN